MKDTQAIEMAFAALINSISRLTNAITPHLSEPEKPEPEQDKYLTGKEVDKILKISSVTRHRYANEGILTRHKLSKKNIMYKQEEVLKLLAASEV